MSRSRRFLVKSMRLAHLACRLSVALFSVSSQGIAVLAKPKHVGNFYRGIEACSGGFRLQGFAVKVRQFRLKAYNRASVIQGKWVQSTVSCGPGQGEHEAKRAVSGACSMPKFRVEGIRKFNIECERLKQWILIESAPCCTPKTPSLKPKPLNPKLLAKG